MKFNGSFEQGKLTCTAYNYNEKETLILSEEYKNGVKEGNSYAYYDNVAVESSGYYKNNKKDGKWEFWYPSGEMNRNLPWEGDLLTKPFLDALT